MVIGINFVVFYKTYLEKRAEWNPDPFEGELSQYKGLFEQIINHRIPNTLNKERREKLIEISKLKLKKIDKIQNPKEYYRIENTIKRLKDF
ncbi:MAG: hypothetical protein GF329_16560 [Candidatus Lokiarchaeota archaeon]|nr:hypothetical protein [Candidatus Lokiarchaeota archaeon]